ncbi:chlorophyll A-B binding protein [Nitzschia inconspicua]|uniref:Chlorophyll A-B binding protein n=1 Tax=Nitzschia inconspicua TaxID=303405 RepID=A0A9K3KNI1_9STRA|nr:chlorophyll A-B binding protein [Nitzschia inconspicua]
MSPFRTILTLFVSLSVVSAFGPSKPAATTPKTSLSFAPAELYESAQKDWEGQFAPLAKYGWGPSVQAEKWNGRHAMFGWFFICATAYCKGHGLIPDADTLLDFSEWGTLATISGKTTITNERAIILMANAHFFGVSLMATISPLPFGDSLLLDPNDPMYEKQATRNSQPFGYLPAFKLGLTEEAEIINGRLAMLGIISLLFATAIEQKPMLDIVNEWVGGLYY